jgi:alcohol dehydrogenase
MSTFDFQPRIRVIFGAGTFERLGELARELGFRRTLLVSDAGLIAAGHVGHATSVLQKAGISVAHFHDFRENPDSDDVERGRAFAAQEKVDSIIGMGGGSSLDCAKGINFVLTNGGRIEDYRGYGKAAQPLLPMLGVPTTTGTGSEAQSYAVVASAENKMKMACGDPKAAFRIALLDPTLVTSQPKATIVASGFDAMAHAVETCATTRRNLLSRSLSREAWRLLEANFEEFESDPRNLTRAGEMLFAAHLAGAAIENSMLGAAHACANPLTARYDVTHGLALCVLLPHVVLWNWRDAGTSYAELQGMPEIKDTEASRCAAAETLAWRLRQIAISVRAPRRLSELGVKREDLPLLAEQAAQQWTGTFNPRPFDAAGALEIYEWAF